MQQLKSLELEEFTKNGVSAALRREARIKQLRCPKEDKNRSPKMENTNKTRLLEADWRCGASIPVPLAC